MEVLTREGKPRVMDELTEMKLVGRCKDCRFWELPAVGTSGCPIVITTTTELWLIVTMVSCSAGMGKRRSCDG